HPPKSPKILSHLTHKKPFNILQHLTKNNLTHILPKLTPHNPPTFTNHLPKKQQTQNPRPQ
ncbi:hypothetical protein, partial [Bacillus altitudinis]|uniref:hypothetical protein n=1 Tax=Bacillus altitudinis TaxID=293387 RepID=UPI003B52A5EF